MLSEDNRWTCLPGGASDTWLTRYFFPSLTLSFTSQEISPCEPHVFGLLQPMTSPTLKQTLGLFPRSKGNWEGIYSLIHLSNHSFTHSISVTSMLSTPWCQSQG